jgi:hypothetical protein
MNTNSGTITVVSKSTERRKLGARTDPCSDHPEIPNQPGSHPVLSTNRQIITGHYYLIITPFQFIATILFV